MNLLSKAGRVELEARVSALEKANGWDRRLGYAQVKPQPPSRQHLREVEALYEFGRFAALVDLLEE